MGDGCWVRELCHKRCTITKSAPSIIATAASSIGGKKKSPRTLDAIAIPTVPAVVVYFYRQRKDEPLHAISVELWIGQQKKAVTEPVHTLGWRETQVREYITNAIAQFNQQYGVSISAIAATVELNPSLCLLSPCPLKLGEC